MVVTGAHEKEEVAYKFYYASAVDNVSILFSRAERESNGKLNLIRGAQ